MIPHNTGVLITNIGTPNKPTTSEVRAYLKQFLSDPRIVDMPQLLWQPILHGIILPIRAKRSAKLYQQIWTEEGPPLIVYMQKIADKLQTQLNIPVVYGMQYGTPSIETALNMLKKNNIDTIVVLPLYPQYSKSTTEAAFDNIHNEIMKWQTQPNIRLIHQYAEFPDYINALSRTIQKTWEAKGKPQHLLFSFHGLPQRYINKGDPYATLCENTANTVAQYLHLQPHEWSISFQSRVGYGQWLSPYTQTQLLSLPKKGITHLHVICPGFSVDCLETLEEINIKGKAQFLKAGGQSFHYIPALNDSSEHIMCLSKLIRNTLTYVKED